MAKRMNAFDWIASVLLIIGGLNWGLVGIFDFNLVAFLFSESFGIVGTIIYVFVGIAALYSIFRLAYVAATK